MTPASQPSILRSLSCSPLRVALALAALCTAACSSQPVPLSAQAGSSIAIAVSGEMLDGERLGYGGDWLAAMGRQDAQRGELLFVLRDAAGVERTLRTRVVTRVAPDPASDAALDQRVDPWLGAAAGLAQAIAIVEIPADVPPGSHALELRRQRALASGGFESLPAPGYHGTLRVLPALVDGHTGQPNEAIGSAGGWMLDTRSRLAALHPNPKLVLPLPAGASAAHLVVAYPRDKVAVRGVIEEQHTGRGSIVLFDDDPASGRVGIDLVAPERDVAGLALVFTLRSPASSGAASPAEFQVVSSALYDDDGASLPATITPGPIR